MNRTHQETPRANAAIWLTIGVVAIAVAGAPLLTGVEIAWHTFLVPALLTLLLTLGGLYYRTVRGEYRLGAILGSTAQIIGFAAVAAPLSYIAALPGLALQDTTFAAWDHHLHFDWMQMMRFISSHDGLQHVLGFAYSSFELQSVTTIMALGIAGQLDRLTGFVAAFVVTTLITIALSAVYPAAGPWLFLDIQPADANGFLPLSSTSWPVLLGLR